VIYFYYQGDVYTMNDDGSGIALVPRTPEGFSAHGVPSRQLHAGKRWFLSYYPVPGEFYPDGNPRDQFVALSDGGDVVPLPLPADLDPLGDPRWGVGDGFLSWVGRRWGSGTVVEGGLYITGLTFDDQGGVNGVTSSTLLVDFPLVVTEYSGRSGLVPDIVSHDWSPNGTKFVFENDARDTLAIHNVQTGGGQVIFADPVQPMNTPLWSPAGDRIMFNYFTGWNQVTLINPDGSGLKKLVGSAPSWSRTAGVWSPTGSHLLYQHRDHFYQDSYIVRVKANGSDPTRVTGKDLGWGFSYPRPMGWR